MESLNHIKQILFENKQQLEEKYFVKDIGIFGSYVKGTQLEKSDLDILVEFKEPIGLFKFVSLKRYLSDLTNSNVDLVMKTSLKPRIGKNILKEVVYI